MRLTYPKSDPMNHNAKILLNSLYGVFGMRDKFYQIKIINSKEFEDISSENHTSLGEISEVIQLDDQYLIQYNDISNTVG